MNIIYTVISFIVTFALMIAGTFTGTNFFDTNSDYKKNVSSVEAYSNTLDTAVPMTDIYDMIESHFNAPLAQGKTEKKVAVIGYDGCRADALSLLDGETDDSAISYLLSTGAEAKIAYCGGVNYPEINTQATSTAPGWCSILTGEWADVHGIDGNDVIKSNDHLTLLTTLVEDDVIDSSSFYVSWQGHFSADESTYKLEKQYVEDNNLDVTFLCADDDEGTFGNVYADINSADCSDFIFTIFEYTDHVGHDTGFSIKNPEYVQALDDADSQGKALIDAIESRATYETEDWLIIITSDHGGYNTGHGNLTMQERYTFIVAR